mmetsp:Transcript_29661/g.59898  ORF Transcript_29661/g.59898 Transcript_29661/m.59898 type:complete len:129 (-) Transcript_29661:659-1045(-)
MVKYIHKNTSKIKKLFGKNYYIDFIPIKTRSCSKITSWMVVVGANRDQIGKNPRQRVRGPSFLIILMKQSPALEYIFASAGWFMRRVRTMSKGETVQVMKNPAATAEMNCVTREVFASPVYCTTYPLV